MQGREESSGCLLHQAALYDNIELLQSLLEGDERKNIDMQDMFGRTPLYTAVTNDAFRCAQLLLRTGADVNIASGIQCGYMTPLHVAALGNKHRFVALLLQSYADPSLTDTKDQLPLDLAVAANDSDECVRLITVEMERRHRDREKVEIELQKACRDGDAIAACQVSRKMDAKHVTTVINTLLDGQISLLHKACENSNFEMIYFLICHGTESLVHPVTGHTVLHSACIEGSKLCAEVVLQNYPELIQAPTIEGILPLHAACERGHADIVALILSFPYPDVMHKMFREQTGARMYRLGFDINAKDGHGRTPLHLAAMNGHIEIVRQLLSFTVSILFEFTGNEVRKVASATNSPKVMHSGKGRESPSLGGSASRSLSNMANGDNSGRSATSKKDSVDCGNEEAVEQFHPVEVDRLDLDGNSALHLAVKRSERSQASYRQIALALLQHGANANKPLISVGGNSNALLQACSNDDAEMMDLLLDNGATDDDHVVLRSAVEMQNDKMIATVLKYRSHMDAEYQVNHNAARRQNQMARLRSNTKNVWPSVAVVLNWHGLGLPLISHVWLHDVCLLHNSVPSDIHGRQVALAAITRIDLSRNNLSLLPEELFQLPSLRLLNAAENHIRWIPGCEVRLGTEAGRKRSKEMGEDSGIFQCNIDGSLEGHVSDKVASVAVATGTWNAPLLEEVDLHHNQLKDLPADLFKLLSLRKLNVSHNVLEVVPYDMWTSENLVDLNLADNKLKLLPCLRPRPSDHQVAGSDPSSYTVSPDMSDLLQDSDQHGYTDTSDGAYEHHPVQLVSHWQHRLSVTMATVYDDVGDGTTRMSRLSELNLSRNALTSVPEGLSCLAPQLSKLHLSHNNITSVGSIQNLPGGIKWIDLSDNNIARCVLWGGEGSWDGAGSYAERFSTSRMCYGAFCQSRQTKSYMMSPSSTRVRGCHSRNSSSGSLKSTALTTTPGGSSSSTYTVLMSCVHRQHRQLLSLRTLRLAHNGLTRLQLTADEEEGEETGLESSVKMASSSDTDSQRTGSWQSQDLSPRSDPTVFCPNLAVLDLSENALGSITPQVGQLTQLAELKVINNKQLKELPTSLGMLKKLWNLSFGGCPVERNLQGLLGQKAKKTSAVLGYLKSVKDEAVPYNRMKLMLVGIQSIGKTSLLRLLRKEGRANPERSKNWAQRMGQEGMKDKDLKGENISTVGVDIGNLVLQRGNREIIFRTWDFGGQREYYATHQYFLSKRAIYLVLWKITDGEKGVNEILQWLVSVQARAPNSPVIIVGTHLDLITKKKYPVNYLPDLQQLIYDKYMDHMEPEKSGLPRVIGRIEVSCKGRLMFNSHIDELVNMIWSIVLEEPQPCNRNVRLLEQKVPASYVHLQDVVGMLAEERIQQGKDPVLHTETYKQLVLQKMEELYGTSFRDVTELNQATNFLHENGVLLHYDDTSLQDIYFLDPQWLCDVLASVVTIREINSLAKSGIMRTEDLKILFKNTTFKAEDIKTYIIDLLNKFEVALLWNNQNLLIPSLLPTEMDMRREQPGCDVRIPVRGEMQRQEVVSSSSTPSLCQKSDPTTVVPDTDTAQQVSPPDKASVSKRALVSMVEHTNDTAVSLVRLYLMSYFPSGFWPRLITRLLGDEAFYWLTLDLYNLPELVASNAACRKTLDTRPEWKCWQTGVELTYLGVTVVRLKETLEENPRTFCDYRRCHLVLKQDTDINWVPVNISALSVLEILIPNQSLVVHFDVRENARRYGTSPVASSTMVMRPALQVIASLMARAVDHIDTLLEDWYPDLGVRFVQNSKGMYLITRIVPCIRCLVHERDQQAQGLEESNAWCVVDVSPEDSSPEVTEPIIINGGATDAGKDTGETSGGELEQATWVDSIYSRSKQVAGSVYDMAADATGLLPLRDSNWSFSFAVEDCIGTLDGSSDRQRLRCPRHGPINLGFDRNSADLTAIAPDVMFQDIGDQYLVSDEHVTRGKFLGKGAFGAVYAGTMCEKKSGNTVSVAMKMLQPVPPGKDATGSQRALYQKEHDRWKKEPLKNCCQSYLNVRKELSILLTLHHNNIVPLLGICLHPLCLILTLAPHGALSDKLQDYRRAGARLSPLAVRAVILQVASALAYLHSCQIIYRDLKSENILVWSLPPPHYAARMPYPVKVCLADYGISRTVLPSGVKGLAGTPPFIAPEIIQHNGEEPYTEKVDCFSFGMFMYEMMMLKLPFDGEGSALGGANLKVHIMAGGRPTITHRDLSLPTHFLDLMTFCWAQDPADRPSASEIVSLANTPEFSHLQNVISLDNQLEVSCAGAAPTWQLLDKPGSAHALEDVSPCSDVWIALRTSNESATSQGRIHVYTYHQMECVQAKSLPVEVPVITCLCVTDHWMWCGDINAVIHVFSLQDYTEVLTFPATSRPNVHIKSMAYGRPEAQLYIVLDNGHFIICTVNIPVFEVEPNYTPVKTECPGNGKLIHCISVLLRTPSCSELWCGQSGGCISVWNLHSTTGSLQRLRHPLPKDQAKTATFDVVFVITCPQDSSSVWSYIYPGSVIYRWSTVSMKLTSQTDLSQLMPPPGHRPANHCPQSARLHFNKSQVTALLVSGDNLYIGTTGGRVFILDKVAMTPVTVLHCHGKDAPYIRAILPLPQPHPMERDRVSGQETDVFTNNGIVTIGKGYREMCGRYLGRHLLKVDKSLTYILCWMHEHWRQCQDVSES